MPGGRRCAVARRVPETREGGKKQNGEVVKSLFVEVPEADNTVLDAQQQAKAHCSGKADAASKNSAPSMAARRSAAKRRAQLAKRLGRRDADSEPFDPYKHHGRVSRVIQAFHGEDNWLSQLVIRNFMASVLQAQWRGYVARRKLRAELDRSRTRNRSKATKSAAAERAGRVNPEDKESSAQKSTDIADSGKDIPRAISTKLTGAAALEQMLSTAKGLADVAAPSDGPGDQSALSRSSSIESDWSDCESSELQAVKHRPGTPPWTKQYTRYEMGMMQKLAYQPMRGNLNVMWDPASCQDRLDEVRQRLAARAPARTSEHDAELSPDFINNMLLDRYIAKFQRLGLTTHSDSVAAEF